ncbi:MAG: hypothetical protein HY901_12725 [Deltaproteobacteria bacterium]|nr:hypothetical protein [Deltaproteobacteria bacterium]
MITLTLKREDVLIGEGLLATVADRAAALGLRYISVLGKIFMLETGRVLGSSLQLCRVKATFVEE